MEVAVRVKNARLKDAIGNITKQRDTYKEEADRLRAELAETKAKGDSSALVKRNQELEGRLRVIEHRKVLDAKALAKGVKPEALDAFYKLSEYEPKGEPNEDEIGAFVDSKVEPLKFLVGKEEPAAPTGPIVKPAVGSGKSAPASLVPNGFELPPKGDARWSDPKWYAKNQENLAKVAAEAEAKGIVLEWS